jgi:hypothetical protein
MKALQIEAQMEKTFLILASNSSSSSEFVNPKTNEKHPPHLFP